MDLSGKSQAFVLHFGEMGSRWGFNRTVGQLFALLVIHPEPLNADQMAAALRISRSNVSMGLKELQSWRLVQLHHLPGERKEHFTAAGSVWDLAKTVFEERRKRELDPTLTLLRQHLLEPAENDEEAHAQQRMSELHDLLELLSKWSSSLNTLTPEQLSTLMRMGTGITRVLELKDRVVGKRGAQQGES